MTTVSPQLIEFLLAAWSSDSPLAVEQLDGGTNNLTYLVETRRGHRILRVYPSATQLESVGYEFELLSRLQTVDLSFAVPNPLPAGDGDVLIRREWEGSEFSAALFPFIPGIHATRGPDDLRACATALSELDQALATIVMPSQARPQGPFGLIAAYHPAVPDPLEVLEHLPLSNLERARIARILRGLAKLARGWYSEWPRQIVHRDFDGTNVVLQDGRVTGILDFELAGPDLRPLDLAVALEQFFGGADRSSQPVNAIFEFSTIYQARCPLTPTEQAALPALGLLYRAISLVARAGRWRDGMAPESMVLNRARTLLRRADTMELAFEIVEEANGNAG